MNIVNDVTVVSIIKLHVDIDSNVAGHYLYYVVSVTMTPAYCLDVRVSTSCQTLNW